MTENQEERRSFHRGDFTFNVNYRIMPPNEGRLKAMTGKGSFRGGEKILKINDGLTDSSEKDAPLNPALIDFLMRMDEKLDQILNALADSSSTDRPFRECQGIDISATGIRNSATPTTALVNPPTAG